MKTNTRFIQSIVKTAKTTEVEMPWTRGARRAVFISRRGEQESKRQNHA